MSFLKSSNAQQSESGLSLLQLLFVLAIIGVIVTVVVQQFR